MANLKSFLADLGITKKVLLAPVVMLVFIIGTGAFALSSLNRLDGRIHYITDGLTPESGAASALMEAVYEERLAADYFITHPGEIALDSWQARNESTRRAAAATAELIQDRERAQILTQVQSLQSDYTRAFREEVARPMLEAQRIDRELLTRLGAQVTSRVTTIMELAYGAGAADNGDLANEIVRDILHGRLALQRFLQAADTHAEAQALTYLSRVTENLELLEIIAFSDSAQSESEAALEEWTTFMRAFADVIRLTHQGLGTRNDQLYPLADRMTAAGRALSAHLAEELSALSGLTREQTRAAFSWNALLIALAAIAGLGIALLNTRAVTRPLLRTQREIASMLDDIDAGRGDLKRRVPVSGRDEVGQLSAAFNRFIETLHRIIGDIGESTTSLASAAEELSAVTSQTSAGVQRQNSETDQVATAMNQMTATVQEIARNAAEASQAASDASESASSGRQTVSATVDAIDQLVRLLENGGESVDRLNSDVEAITSIIGVIREVAEQTNLLALNAAIEAARAGEQGRGFAVVADEVRDLAQKTQASTQKIQALIETLQTGARNAVGAMNEGRDQGQKTIASAAEAGSALERIDRKVQAINDMNALIASSAEEQTAVSNDISQSITRIRDIAVETAGGAQQTAGSSEELARLGERLNKLVRRFQV
jgi:methyl-accepting chemotaxis protein